MKKIVGYIILLLIFISIFILGFRITKTNAPNIYYKVYLDGNVIGTIKSKEKLEKYINDQGILIKNQVIDYQNKIEIINKSEELINSDIFGMEMKQQVANLNYYKEIYNNLNKMVDAEGYYTDELTNVELELNKLDKSIFKYEYDNKKIKDFSSLLEQLDNEILKINISIYENIDKPLLNESDAYYLNQYISLEYNKIKYSKEKYMREYISEYEIYAHVNNVYKPLGINIKKINTYKNDVETEETIYNKIINLKPCTIEGYQFKIKRESSRSINKNTMFASLSMTDYGEIKEAVSNDIIVYVTDKEIFDKAVETMIGVFVGNENYQNYRDNLQEEIVTTGTNIEDIYIDESITMKQTNISVKEKIYTDEKDLSSYLLYGDKVSSSIAYASLNDTISSFAYKNQISVEEFFLFNKEFTSINQMFYDGQPIVITRLNPQISLVVSEHSVVDVGTSYNTIEKYNSSLNVGSVIVVQQGQNGIERVSQKVTKVNGAIKIIEPISKETIVGSTSEIIEIGTRVVPHVGSTSSWGWPTDSGYTISSYYGYRPAIFGSSYHSGIDIAGTGMGSPVYAANNGTIITKTSDGSYGNYLQINHNNGYYTLYAHLSGYAPGITSGSVVSRGQIIGYVGVSGNVTGPHLHFEIRNCDRYGCAMDPLRFYR